MKCILKSFLLGTIFFGLPISYIYPQPHYIYPQTEKYRFRHLTTDDGLPTNWCWQVMKDSKGFIWITTRAGLCRYDGYNVKVFQHDPSDSSSLSDNRITKKDCILEDHNGNIWVGTMNGLNKYDPVLGKFYQYYHNPNKAGSIGGNTITCLLEDWSGILWIGTGENGGLNRFNPSDTTFSTFTPVSDNPSSGIPVILSLLDDQKERFWVGTTRGLFLFDRGKGLFSSVQANPAYPEMKNPPYCKTIHEDLDGTIFIGTPQGFIVYDSITSQLIPYQPLFHANLHITNTDFLPRNFDNEYTHWVISIVGLYGFNKHTSYFARVRPDPYDDQGISGNSLKSIFRDETGLIWIPGEFGVNILDPVRQRIINYPGIAGDYGEATCFLEDREGYLWKGSDHLEKFDQRMNLIKSYQFPLKKKGKITFTGAVLGILEDQQGNLWVGNDHNGLFLLRKGDDELVPCTFSKPGVNFIWDLFEDSSGMLWVGTNSGLFCKKPGDESFTQFYNLSGWGILNGSVILDITEDRAGNLWIATAGNGLFYQTPDQRDNDHFFHIQHDPGNKNSLSSNWIWAIHEDLKGNLWIATEYGLNKKDRKENRFIRYLSKTDPGANFIYDIIDDTKGSLWLATESGIIRFMPNQGDTNSTGSGIYRQILPFDDIFPYRIYRNSSGYIFVGGSYNSGKGYYRFHPDSIEMNRHIPAMVLTDFRVDNSHYPLDTMVTLKKKIVLKHDQNFFTIECSALDYLEPEKNQYAHFLEGFEDDWINTGTNRLANYTDVPPGTYTFHAKGSNNNGFWNEKGVSLVLTILPPPWKTWWAYTIYCIGIIAIIFLVIRFYLRRLHLLQRLKLEEVEAQKMKELDRLKSRFFANISHEFRTPLTLILGPVEKVLSSVTGEVKNDLMVMQRNARRLQQLINELLSLSKLESGQMKLHTQEVNIVEIAKSYLQQFESLAIQKKISLDFSSAKYEILLYVDIEKIEKILFNLLSNALKYTPEGGTISICFLESKVNDLCISFTVSDTGLGIPSDSLSHIFNRFYQVDESNIKDQEGTGIGLALTKELVELHRGDIWVDSEPGKGTIFTIKLPCGKDHLKDDEILDIGKSVRFIEPDPLDFENHIDVATTINEEIKGDERLSSEGNKLALILIVEDNADLREYIRNSLGQSYKILEAQHGGEGLSQAINKIPDLIISDVMMPEMDGFELCKKLKTDERTSHIPVILLTARAGMESKIEGLETGADDYITKPFDARELLTRIKNLLELRQKLRERFLKDAEKIGLSVLVDLPEAGISSMEQKFLQKAIGIVNANLSDPDFTVKRFCAEMAMSNMQLHRKLVAVTFQTANRFIRTYRLNRAAILLEKRAGNVTEVAYEVGFNNLSWFAKCFQEQFGMPPSEYPTKKESL